MVTTSATELYPVRSYEVDLRGRLTPSSLCNYLQESAGLHARQLGVSVEQLKTAGMTWFLWRLHVWIERLPTWTETVAIETWPAEMGRPYAIRDFRIRAGEDEIGVATSAWLLMDLEARRPIRRVPDRIRDLHPVLPQRALRDTFKRLPACEVASSQCELRVRRADLDLNGHLNHVAAISAMIEAVPPEIIGDRRLVALEVELKGEGHHGDVLTSRCEGVDTGGEALRHSLSRDLDSKELARGRSRWRRDRGVCGELPGAPEI